MTLEEFRHLLNTLPLTADKEKLLILDGDTAETFSVVGSGVDADGTPVIKIQLN